MADLTTPEFDFHYANPDDPLGGAAASMGALALDVEDFLLTARRRIATEEVTADSGAISTTEAVVATVTGTLVAGYRYEVCFEGQSSGSTAGNDNMAKLREDNLTGTQLFQRQVDHPLTNVWEQFRLRREYVAAASGSKTFVVTFDLVAGTGSVMLRAVNHPALFTIDYIADS